MVLDADAGTPEPARPLRITSTRRAAGRITAIAALVAAVGWILLRPTAPAATRSIPVIDPSTGAAVVEAARVGRPAPPFAWSVGGNAAGSLESLRGRVVVLNWWATWCPSCREEMPALDRIAATERDVVVLAVDLHQDEGMVEGYLGRLGLRHMLVVIDPDGSTARRYAFPALPSTYFVDAAGMVRHVALGGPMSEEQIRAGIAAARAGR